jgi:nascent polypeptide-associated complex subunit alpha
MMPNMDPKALKKMMERMGIKSEEIEANRVVIEGKEKDIIINNPQIMTIEAQGTKSFQISGEITEKEKGKVEVTADDIKTVMDASGIYDEDKVRSVLADLNGDIAASIIKLKDEKEQKDEQSNV